MSLLFLFIAGASVGSFLNVCIWRLPRGESIVAPPSHCPQCERQLQALDLVPLFSQLFLRSRCRYCGTRISWRYFSIELLTGILWVLVGLWAGPFGIDAVTGSWTGDWLRLAQGVIFVSCLVVISAIDYDTRLIQLEAVFLLGLAAVAFDAWRTTHGMQTLSTGGFWPGHSVLPAPLPGSLWAMVVIATMLWIVREGFSWFYGKEAMGFGDVMLAGAIAAHLGWNGTLWTFSFCSVVIGTLVGVTLQIPRAVRAYRWANRRGSKYFERATKAYDLPAVTLSELEDVPDTNPVAPVSETPLGTPTFERATNDGKVLGTGGEQSQEVPAQEVPAQEVPAQEVPATVIAASSPDSEAISPEGAPASAEIVKISDRQRGEHWKNLAGSLARHAFRKAIPFGPMLAIGAVLALLYGEPLNRAYLNWLGNPTSVSTSETGITRLP